MALQNKLIENADGSLTSISTQTDSEIKQIAEDNAALRFDSARSGRAQYDGDSQFSHRVARIPMLLVEQMMREGVWGNQERMKEWMNDPVNAPFRTTKGKL
jgi:hypothetical protein